MTAKSHATSSSGRSCRRSRTRRSTRTSTRSSSRPTPTRSRSRTPCETIFGVQVTNVNTLNRKGKRKRTGAPAPAVTAAQQARPRVPRRGRSHRDLRELTTMPVRKRKPTSPGRRFQTVSDFAEITRDRPEKSLTKPKPRTGGRNSYGRMTSRHRGGGHKKKYRLVDFRRDKDGVPAKVASIEYDPNRNAAHRAAALPRRREALHHRPERARGRRHAPERAGVGDPPRQRAAAALHPGRYHGAQRRAQARRRRQARPRAPAPRSNSWRRKVSSPPCGFRPRRCGGCRSTAAAPWARSATPRPGW